LAEARLFSRSPWSCAVETLRGFVFTPTMPIPAALQPFVDDELLRAPLLVEQALEAVLEQMHKGMQALPPAERIPAGDIVQALTHRHQRVVDAYAGSLRSQLQKTPAPPNPARAVQATSLSLVDEAEVAVDVEMSHAIEGIKSVAEYELRELQTYLSALVGDMDVAGDHNPMRPETHARALWSAAEALTTSRGQQVAFMRRASKPLAQVLRKSYAGAVSRLEAAGVTPAAYRTLILPAGARRDRSHETGYTPALSHIRDVMPVPAPSRSSAPAPSPGQAGQAFEQVLRQTEAQFRRLPPDSGRAEFDRLRDSQRTRLMESAGNPVDQQLIELLSRLFDAMLADRRLAPDMQLLLSRLQAPALRVLLHDAATLDDYGHPLWLFLDRLAFLPETLPAIGDAERGRLQRHAQAIVEHLIGEPRHDAALYRWALSRLGAFERNRLEQRRAAATGEIDALQQLEDHLLDTVSPPATYAGALDVAQLDTVPAELFDAALPAAPPNNGEGVPWLAERQAGDWLRVVLQGQWVNAQLLWPGERGEVWLLADGASQRTWAVRRGALLALHAARLLEPLVPRSLLREAARKVLKRLKVGDGR
jgi:Protein of unknown function (DUF1631)